ncbi:MAG: DUF917 domain-containing protein [Treponema sp.]|jgi:DUF917 family protein|nr:DUF917 domain-containing protein [Treponema sp.]
MKTLNKQELYDILYGCAVLGTGGGGSLEKGLFLIDKALAAGKSFRLESLAAIPDDALMGVPYGCGATGAGEDKGPPGLTRLDEPLGVLAARAMEAYQGKPFYALMSTELGGGNTAEALYTAAVLDRVIADADPAGRSVPELQHSTFFLHGVPITPMAVADAWGNTAIFTAAASDERAEAWARALAVASGNSVGVLDHPAQVKNIRGKVIEGAISYALEIGKALREAKEQGLNPVDAVTAAGGGKTIFSGVVSAFEWEFSGGFTLGTVELEGRGTHAGHTCTIWFKNEFLISWLDGKIHATAPELICLMDRAGNSILTPFVEKGSELTVFVLPAPKAWTTPRGLEVFGPKHFGYDVPFRPLC